ncbi:hydroxypyruvate isomerase family protein [Actinomadura madurae]|uniref:hydroxypyruvate isomerase family protein n=1 Tax=Actinomadura madurae TaxID=1993 RepID=UPI002026BB04|nr:TIM barrel protein [Actinomadura madurae]MCP9983432.1 TIM barrel protein [Actinomadura madurae]URN10359.1 TIM barrel protein [Actinomadura madurae]
MTRRFAVNCSILFTEAPLLERPAAARAAGFGEVEFWWPWPGEPDPPGADVDAFCRVIEDAGVRLIGLNLYAGDMPAGERGVLSDPSRVEEFRACLPVVRRIAGRTGVRSFNALYGQRLDGVAASDQDRVATENLVHAARSVGEFGGNLLIEPLARGLNGAYPLETAADAMAVVSRVRAAGAANVRFLFDTFHLATNGDDLEKAAREHAADIGHVQIADAPGRGRPGTGRIDFDRLFAVLDGIGYTGRIALEYVPQGPSPEEFGWTTS